MDRTPGVRASGPEHEDLIERLRLAYSEGRLTLEELVQRTETAYRAATRE